MSKESRRAARLARESRRAGSGATQPGSAGGATAPSGSGGPAAPARPTARPVSAGPVRAGRRDRVRSGPPPTFLERYRSLIVTVAGVAIVGVVAYFLFVGATQPAFACSSIFDPSPTPTVDPSSSTRLGFQEDDMGANHVAGPPVTYLFCPPASGNHMNVTGVAPAPPRVYRPDDKIGPLNWVHNLEHGGMVVLYKGDSPGATQAGQQAFKDYYDSFPASPVCGVPRGQISPVIARFDDMPHAYAALVWDRVFYLDTWDPALVTKFYLTESERLDVNGQLVAPPEKVYCNPSARPLESPAASASAGDSGSVAPSASADVASPPPPSSAPSAAPSAAPSSS
ncbi:MAG TPA: DUF3105 domain-containing protein [Candidatus Limnocylindrales bacterium]|nr:DUF3105 domain-containing protein [Candidatus Limnocylindrales bacterium]